MHAIGLLVDWVESSPTTNNCNGDIEAKQGRREGIGVGSTERNRRKQRAVQAHPAMKEDLVTLIDKALPDPEEGSDPVDSLPRIAHMKLASSTT